MAAVFYFCALQHHQTRITGKSGKRLRCEFPSRPWFVSLVAKHSLQEWLRKGRDSRHVTPKFMLMGLMKCAAGVAADDFMSPYAARDELDMWRHFWAGMGNLFTVLVEECFMFTSPQAVHTYLEPRGPAVNQSRPLVGKPYPLSPFMMQASQAEQVLTLQGDLWQFGRGHLLTCTAAEACRRWGLDLTAATLAVPVVEPISSLIAQGAWQSIGLLGHWALSHELFEDDSFPPDTLKELRFQEEDVHWSAALSPSKLSSLGDRVRSWAPLVLQGIQDEDERATARLELADTLHWVESLQASLQSQARPHEYPSNILIASVFLTFLLGSRKHVAEAVPLALRVALPGLDLEELARHLQIPRTTTVARAATYLDLAFVLYMRDKMKQCPPVLYAWADSSPQSGREWFMSMRAECARDSLLETYHAVNTLIKGRSDLQDHAEAEEVDLDELVRCNELLQRSLAHHKQLPVAMGSGRTKLEDKTSCLLHTLGLESESRPALFNHLQNVVSWTSDMGTEVQLPQFQALDVQTLLPGWLHGEVLASSDVEQFGSDTEGPDRPDAPAAAPAEPEQLQSLMPNCLIIPGCLHIFHNLSADVHHKMEWWNPFWEQLKDVACLLAERHLRERFINFCLRGTASAQYEPDFHATGVSKLYEKRWQNVITCLDNLLPLFEPLRQAWDLQSFMANSGIESKVPEGVEKALTSPLFCRYVYMVYGVHKVMSNFEFWLESCPCHERLREGEEPSKKRSTRKRKVFATTSVKTCVMKGKRSCEMAAGAADSTIQALNQLAFRTYVEGDDDSLPQEHLTIIMRDFEFAKTYLEFGIKTKLSFWQTLPWRLCGLGHHWSSVARHSAKQCLQEYDSSLADAVLPEHHHPVTRKFLLSDGPLRPLVEAFADGAPMSDELARAVAELKFIPCVERVVEGLHRDIKIASKHVQLGPTKVSLTLRLPEIKARLSESPEFLPRITELFDQVRNLKRAAASLGVHQHPDILQLILNGNVETTSWWTTLQQVVHRCALGEQFADFQEARKHHDEQQKLHKALVDRVHDRHALPTPRTYDSIVTRCICDHFKRLADSSSFFSLPATEQVPGDSYQLVPLQPGAAAEQLNTDMGLGADVEEVVAEDPLPRQDMVVFRILYGSPERLKLAPGPVAMKQLFAKGDTVVTVHKVVHDSDEGPIIDVSATAAPQLLRKLEECPLPTLRNDLQVWKLSPNVSYTLPCIGFPSSDVCQLVTALLDAKGIPDEPYVLALPGTDSLCQQLERQEYLQLAPPRPDSSSLLVRLTPQGMATLRIVSALTDPRPVCSQSTKALGDCDTLELLLALEGEGWTWEAMPSSKRAKQALSYSPGGPKVWYSLSHFISKSYLRCLLEADAICNAGVIDAIPHWVSQPDKVYPAILRGEGYVPAREPLPALEQGDVDEGGALADASADAGQRKQQQVHDAVQDMDVDAVELDDDELNRELARLFEEQADDDDEDEAEDDDAVHDAGLPPDAHDEPPPPAAPAAAVPVPPVPSAHRRRRQSQDALDDDWSGDPALDKPSPWGCFRITPKQPGPTRLHGGFEARCPFHRKNDKTECKRFLSLRDSSIEEREKTLRALRAWCNAAPLYDRQRGHLHHFVSADTAPADEVLVAGRIADPPAAKPATDVELDAIAAAAADAARAGAGAGAADADDASHAHDAAHLPRARGTPFRLKLIVFKLFIQQQQRLEKAGGQADDSFDVELQCRCRTGVLLASSSSDILRYSVTVTMSGSGLDAELLCGALPDSGCHIRQPAV
ncbi:unnamed protein product [Symbiodinium sp. KB8]|nr:unnamed protein product [Symbiodinium sp. KB8]